MRELIFFIYYYYEMEQLSLITLSLENPLEFTPYTLISHDGSLGRLRSTYSGCPIEGDLRVRKQIRQRPLNSDKRHVTLK